MRAFDWRAGILGPIAFLVLMAGGCSWLYLWLGLVFWGWIWAGGPGCLGGLLFGWPFAPLAPFIVLFLGGQVDLRTWLAFALVILALGLAFATHFWEEQSPPTMSEMTDHHH